MLAVLVSQDGKQPGGTPELVALRGVQGLHEASLCTGPAHDPGYLVPHLLRAGDGGGPDVAHRLGHGVQVCSWGDAHLLTIMSMCACPMVCPGAPHPSPQSLQHPITAATSFTRLSRWTPYRWTGLSASSTPEGNG